MAPTPDDLEHERLKLELARLELEKRRLELEAAKVASETDQKLRALQEAKPEEHSEEPQEPEPASSESTKGKAPKRRRLSSSGRTKAAKAPRAEGPSPVRRKDNTTAMIVFGGILAAASVGGLLYFFGDRDKLGWKDDKEPKEAETAPQIPVKTEDALDKLVRLSAEERAREMERRKKLDRLRQREEARREREAQRRERERQAVEEKARKQAELDRVERLRKRRENDRRALFQATNLREHFMVNPTVGGFGKLRDKLKRIAHDRPMDLHGDRVEKQIMEQLAIAREPLAKKLAREIRTYKELDSTSKLLERIETLEGLGAKLPTDIAVLKGKAMGSGAEPPPKLEEDPKPKQPKTHEEKVAAVRAAVKKRVTAWLKTRTGKALYCRACDGAGTLRCEEWKKGKKATRWHSCSECRNGRVACTLKSCANGMNLRKMRRAFYDPISPKGRKTLRRDTYLQSLATRPSSNRWVGRNLVIDSFVITSVVVGESHAEVHAKVTWGKEPRFGAGGNFPYGSPRSGSTSRYKTSWIRVGGKYVIFSQADLDPEKLVR